MASFGQDNRQRMQGLLLLAPAIVFLLVWFVWPVCKMLLLSVTMHNVDGAGVPDGRYKTTPACSPATSI